MRDLSLSLALGLAALALTISCKDDKKDPEKPGASVTAPAIAPSGTPTSTTTIAASANPNPAPVAPAGNPPPDGKYERVTVEGVTVPMIQVMNNGGVVLVDTDGKKPRSWEEQYKRKRDLLPGQYDLHKTNANKNDTFEDDAIDKEGLWVIDEKGNITKH